MFPVFLYFNFYNPKMNHSLLFTFLYFFLFFGLRAQNNNLINTSILPNKTEVNTKAQYKIYITPNAIIKKGAFIKLNLIKGWRSVQNISIALEGFTSVSAISQQSSVKIVSILQPSIDAADPWHNDVNQRIITLQILQSDFLIGDTILLKIGGNSNINGSKMHTSCSTGFIEVAVNNVNGNWVEQINTPKFEIVNQAAKSINIYLPSVIKIGEPTKVKLAAMDQFSNWAIDFVGSINLQSSDGLAEFPSSVQFFAADKGYKEIMVVFNSIGNQSIKGTIPSMANKVVVSNQAIVSQEITKNVLWGDFHCHSAFSRDGMGACAYEFAQFATCLDFFSATDHADHPADRIGIDDEEWQELIDCSLFYEKPNEFIPFLGYEISDKAPTGHNNFIFNYKNSDVGKIPVWNNDNDFEYAERYLAADSIDASLKLLIIPHHTGKVFYDQTSEGSVVNNFGGEYMNDKYKRLIELYSGHGSSEFYNPTGPLSYENTGDGGSPASSSRGPHYAQDAWALKEKLGVIASTDNHSSQPGLVALVAAITEDKSRNGIFDAIYNRKCYGTTGERIVLDFSIDSFTMGEILDDFEGIPTIKYSVLGTDTLDFVEVLKWDFKNGIYENNHPKFEIIYHKDLQNSFSYDSIIDNAFDKECMYYLRVKQKKGTGARESWAWSSPIWVNKSNVTQLNHFEKTNYLSISPNPIKSGDKLNLDFKNIVETPKEIQIYNLLGVEVSNIDVLGNLKNINIPKLVGGYYIVNCLDFNGQLIGSNKLLITE